jgi:hypothetical protein
MVGPRAVSANALSKEVNVPQSTLSAWLRRAGSVSLAASEEDNEAMAKKKRRKEWTVPQKLRVLTEAEGLNEQDLGALLRREGLHSKDLERWRARAAEALGSGSAEARATSADRKRIKELERELLRKDKALAEAAALLVLRKKLEALQWFEDDAPTDASETQSSRSSKKR